MILKINSDGTIKSQEKSLSLSDQERIVKISNDRWLKKGTLILTDSCNVIHIPEYADVGKDCKTLQLTDSRSQSKSKV